MVKFINSIGHTYNSKRQYLRTSEGDRIIKSQLKPLYKKLSINKRVAFWNYVYMNFDQEDALLKSMGKNILKYFINTQGKVRRLDQN